MGWSESTFPHFQSRIAADRRGRLKVGNLYIFPCSRIALGYAAARFGKSSIADGAVTPEKLTRGRANRLGCSRRERLCYALIALTMVVGAHIEIRMGFAAIPANDFVRVKCRSLRCASSHGICFRKPQPAARNHRVGFQQLKRTGRAHLG